VVEGLAGLRPGSVVVCVTCAEENALPEDERGDGRYLRAAFRRAGGWRWWRAAGFEAREAADRDPTMQAIFFTRR
jgi:hypothetical protein